MRFLNVRFNLIIVLALLLPKLGWAIPSKSKQNTPDVKVFDASTVNTKLTTTSQPVDKERVDDQPVLTIAKGGSNSGGGDNCEMRIQEIRDDIRIWIESEGHEGLIFKTFSKKEYERGMLTYLSILKNSNGSIRPATQIECTRNRVFIKGDEKICRFDKLSTGSKITCNYNAFMDSNLMSEDEQYRLIHHEYAGLAGLENPADSQSQYEFSDQISKFLETRSVRRLSVRPTDTNEFFTVLKRKFEEGTLPSEKLGPGRYAGRCIFPGKRDTPEAAMLVIAADDLPSNGPFFNSPGRRKFKSQILYSSGSRADIFDSLPENQFMRYQVTLALEKVDWLRLNETQAEFVVPHLQGDVWYRVRENSGAFVVENHRPRRIYCYFFKDVTDP